MKLVEIIPGLATSKDTLAGTLELAKAMNKITTESKDVPGFIANRVLMPYINEAVFVLQEVKISKDKKKKLKNVFQCVFFVLNISIPFSFFSFF